MRKNKLEKRTSRSIFSLLLTGLFLFITGCKEKIPEIQIDMPGTTSRYMKLNLSSANHMNITHGQRVPIDNKEDPTLLVRS